VLNVRYGRATDGSHSGHSGLRDEEGEPPP